MANIKYYPTKSITIKTTTRGKQTLSSENISNTDYIRKAIDKKRKNYLQASRKIANFNIKKDGSNLSESGQERQYLTDYICECNDIESLFANMPENQIDRVKVSIFDSIKLYDNIDNIKVNRIIINETKQKTISFKISNILEKTYVNIPLLVSEIISIASSFSNGVKSVMDILPVLIIATINVYCMTVDELDSSFIPVFKAFLSLDSPYEGINKSVLYNKIHEFDKELPNERINELLQILHNKKTIIYDGDNIILKEHIEIH